MADKTRVLILGRGFGGLYAALEFEKGNDPRFEVTVVNRENFFLFTPMMHEIAASDLDLTNLVNPVRKMTTSAKWMTGRSVRVDGGEIKTI
jgi:NADH:quinone reductase (non-electrogenic)